MKSNSDTLFWFGDDQERTFNNGTYNSFKQFLTMSYILMIVFWYGIKKWNTKYLLSACIPFDVKRLTRQTLVNSSQLIVAYAILPAGNINDRPICFLRTSSVRWKQRIIPYHHTTHISMSSFKVKCLIWQVLIPYFRFLFYFNISFDFRIGRLCLSKQSRMMV